MANQARTRYVTECFWPGVRDEDLREVDLRVRAVAGSDAETVRYLGWRLVIEDEVVWLEFEGPLGTVRRLAEQAEVPFGRILLVACSPDPV